jgi:CHAT domain-containing protein
MMKNLLVLLILLQSVQVWCNQQSESSLQNLHSFTEIKNRGIHFSELNRSDSAIAYFRTALSFAEDADSIAQALLLLSNEYRLNQDIENAKRYLNQFNELLLSNSIKNKAITYESLHLEGKIKISQSDFVSALQLFDSALMVIEQIEGKNALASIKVINYKGIAFYYLGDQDQAFYYYREALEKCLRLGIKNIDLADVYQNMAIAYSFKGEFDSALFYLENSRVIREQIFSDFHPRMAGFYVNYGRILSMVGRSVEAFMFYQKADKIMNEYAIENDLWWGHLQVNIGAHLQLRNDYEKALIYYQSALKIYKSHYNRNHPLIITASNNIANIYNLLGDYNKAKYLSESFISLPGNALNKVQLYRNLAKSYAGLNNQDQAVATFRRSVQIALDELGPNHLETANSLITLADYLKELGEYEQAVIYYQEASEIFYKIFGASDTEYANAIRKLATAYSLTQDFARADSLFLRSEKLLSSHINSSFSGTGKTESNSVTNIRLVDVYFWWAIMYHSWFQKEHDLSLLDKSLGYFDHAIDIYDQVGLFVTDESRMLLNQNVKIKLAEAIDVAAILYQQTGDTVYAEKAFYYAEKGRASVLLASIRKSEAMIMAGVHDSLIQREQQLRDDLSVIQKLIYEEQQKSFPNENRIAIMEKRQLQMMEAIDKIFSQIRSDYPDYADLMFNSEVIKLAEVQQQLGPDDFFISYASGNDNLYLIYADKESCGLHKIEDKKGIIEEKIDLLLSQFKQDLSKHATRDFQQFIDLAGYLYEHLLDGVIEKAQGRKLLILPEGRLGYLPFEILLRHVDSIPQRIDYRNLPYLIKDFPIAYCYSATLHFSQLERKQRGNGKLLAFVPDYKTFKPISINGTDTINLNELPYAKAESDMVLSVYDGDLAAGDEATKANFKENASGYSMLHLAMHTVLDDEKPLYSRLIFQQQNDSLDAYSIGTYELFGMDLEASIVVLSACNTGTGKYREGEGIISLTRGFMHAGVPSIVMTNWEVHDQTGAWMMERFYKNLNSGMGKDVALQQAKVDFLAQANQLKSHPYFWASYVVIGDAAPINLQSDYKWIIAAVIIGLLLLIAVIFKLRPINKNRR